MIDTYGSDLRLHLDLDQDDWDDEQAIEDAVDDLYHAGDGPYHGWYPEADKAYYRHLHDDEDAYDDGRPPRMEEWSRSIRREMEYGPLLDDAGATLIPTLLIVDDTALPNGEYPNGGVSGPDYTLLKGHAPDSFADRYDQDTASPGMIDDFAENCAALDLTGMTIYREDDVIDNMATDGNRTYLPLYRQFTSYSSPDPSNPHNEMEQAGLAFIDRSDQRRFQQIYRDARRNTTL